MKNACCARCTKPMGPNQYKVGRYTYGNCCIEKVKEEKADGK